jgi:hypothetical protein
VQIGLRLDVATAQLLQAAAAAEGIPRLATYLRLAVRNHVRQSDRLSPEVQEELAKRIGGPNLPGHLQRHMQNQPAEALPEVISDGAQP